MSDPMSETPLDRVDWSDPLSYVREIYGVPAYVGQRVRFLGRHDGEVVGAEGQYLHIRLDDDGEVLTVHPTWQMEYRDARAAETEANG